MRRTIPLALVAVIALAGCATAGGPVDSSAPPAPGSSTPTTSESAEAPSAEPSDSATADPQPSELSGEPYRIEDEAILGTVSLDDIPQGEPLVIWSGVGNSLVHVFGAGSSSTDCQPTGESADVDGGMLEIDFEWEDGAAEAICTADMRVFGWAFPVTGADASVTQATVDEWTDDADEITVEIQPAEGTS